MMEVKHEPTQTSVRISNPYILIFDTDDKYISAI